MLVNVLLALAVFLTRAAAANDGLALVPPMGWRSWNYFACEVSQSVFEQQIAGLTDRSRLVDGKPTSLADLGYVHVGIDDCWQDCLSPRSYNGSFHDVKGVPLVDTKRFPDLRALSRAASSAGLSLGWYQNNCPETSGPGRSPAYCGEKGKLSANWHEALAGNVAALVEYGFDGVKLDGCGPNNDLEMFYSLVNKTSPRPILIENCHFNTSFPRWADPARPGEALLCPMHFYRVSQDIKANWDVVMRNALATLPYAAADHPMSRPGCWAYADMLEVAVVGQNGHSEGGLSFVEQRTHFGLWCTISSPLVLSFDTTNHTQTNAAWPIVTNREALAVSQSYHGHPGTLVSESKDVWQVWAKPMGNGSTAVLVINLARDTRSFSVALAPFGHVATVRDIWERKNVPFTPGSASFQVDNLESHDSRFLLLTV